jgi:hypothetical protein
MFLYVVKNMTKHRNLIAWEAKINWTSSHWQFSTGHTKNLGNSLSESSCMHLVYHANLTHHGTNIIFPRLLRIFIFHWPIFKIPWPWKNIRFPWLFKSAGNPRVLFLLKSFQMKVDLTITNHNFDWKWISIAIKLYTWLHTYHSQMDWWHG